MDYIRVKNNWSFEESSTGKRMIPFGANFCFPYTDQNGKEKNGLGIMVEESWEPEVILKAFQAATECGMNTMKVFLPVASLLPDPQHGPGAFIVDSLKPSMFERIRFLFQTAESTGVYISLSSAEWGMNKLAWFQDGGNFFGKTDEKNSDSFSILYDFWRQIAAFCQNEPSLFSYNLAVELYIPGGLGGGHEDPEKHYLFSEKWGTPAWQKWLVAKYGDIETVNSLWNKEFSDFNSIGQPLIKWLPAKKTYTESSAMIADYESFKECVVYLFLKNQTEAIRSIDKRHMISCGLHPDQPGIGPIGYAWKNAGMVNKEMDYFDYITVHLYTQIDYLISRPPSSRKTFSDQLIPFLADEETMERRRRECILYARFVHADKPVVLEEFGHLSTDYIESVEFTKKLIESLIGHVSGYQIWNYGSKSEPCDAPMTKDFHPSDFGRDLARYLSPDGLITNMKEDRIPARTIVKLDRNQGMAPDQETAGEKIIRCWDAYLHPIDFEWPLNPEIERYRRENVRKINIYNRETQPC